MGTHEAPDPQKMMSFTIEPDQLPIGPVDIHVPGLELSDNPDEYPVDILNYFRTLWGANGYASARSPYHDTIVLPGKPPIVLVRSYRGMSDDELLDRERNLAQYKEQRIKLDGLQDEIAKNAQRDKLSRILAHIPDMNGLQGIELYRLIIAKSDTPPWPYRLASSDGLSAGQIHRLGPEATTYGLPTRKPGVTSPLYPYARQPEPFLAVDGKNFGPTRDRDHDAILKQTLQLIVPLLRRQSVYSLDV